MTPTGILIQPHATEMMRRRRIATRDLLQALGPNLLDGGRLQAPKATTAHIATPGRPVVLGWQLGPDTRTGRRHLLLARTPAGRHLVIVIANGPASVTVLTVWDQDSQPHLWNPCRLLPTEFGRRSLPPTYWCASGHWDRIGSRIDRPA